MKVTEALIVSKISKVQYMRGPSGTTLTFCIITLLNGFTVVGKSACVDPAEFDEKTGENWAYRDAFNQIWKFEGYLLQEEMFQREQTKSGSDVHDASDDASFQGNVPTP